MKKLLLGLGSIASVVAPVAAVISCGSEDSTKTKTQATSNQSVQATTQDTPEVSAAKEALTVAYNTIQKEDIGATELFVEGISTDDIEADFAATFTMNKAKHIQLGAWGYDMAQGGTVTIAVNKTGAIQSFVKTTGTADVVSHYVTGSQKQLFIDFAKSKGITFTGEIHSAPILANLTPGLDASGHEIVIPYSFEDEKQAFGAMIRSTKFAADLNKLSSGENTWTLEELGLDTKVTLPEGTTYKISFKLDPHGGHMKNESGAFLMDVTLFHGKDVFSAEFTITAKPDVYNFTRDKAVINAVGQTGTNKSMKEIIDLEHRRMYTPEELGLHPKLSEGTTALFTFKLDPNGQPQYQGSTIMMQASLHHGKDSEAKIFMLNTDASNAEPKAPASLVDKMETWTSSAIRLLMSDAEISKKIGGAIETSYPQDNVVPPFGLSMEDVENTYLSIQVVSKNTDGSFNVKFTYYDEDDNAHTKYGIVIGAVTAEPTTEMKRAWAAILGASNTLHCSISEAEVGAVLQGKMTTLDQNGVISIDHSELGIDMTLGQDQKCTIYIGVVGANQGMTKAAFTYKNSAPIVVDVNLVPATSPAAASPAAETPAPAPERDPGGRPPVIG